MKLFSQAKRQQDQMSSSSHSAMPVQAMESRRLLSTSAATLYPPPVDSASVTPALAVEQTARSITTVSDMVNVYLDITGQPGGSVFPPISTGTPDGVWAQAQLLRGFGPFSAGFANGDSDASTPEFQSVIFSPRDGAIDELPPFYAALLGNPLVINSSLPDESATASTASSTVSPLPSSTPSSTDAKIADNDIAAPQPALNQAGTSTATAETLAAVMTTTASHIQTLAVNSSLSNSTSGRLTPDASMTGIVTTNTADESENAPIKLTINLPVIWGIETKLAESTAAEVSTDSQLVMRAMEAELISISQSAGKLFSELVRDISIDLGHQELTALESSIEPASISGWQSWQSATAVAGAAIATAIYLKSEAEPSEEKQKSVFSSRLISTENGWKK